MNIWFIADNHWGHRNIISYENRPFSSMGEMDEFMVSAWNDTVSENDLVFHLGDLFFSRVEQQFEISNQLKGRKILILGNHDRESKARYSKLGFSPYKQYVFENLFLSHHPQQKAPLESLIKNSDIVGNVHGHVHSKIQHLDQSIYRCVSVELNDYKPVHLEELRQHFKI